MIIDLTKIDAKKYRIHELVNSEYITNEDIKGLLTKTFNDILKYYKSPIEKQRLLYKIYMQPYLLCEDSKSKIDTNLIAHLMIKRYAMEIKELNNIYKEGSIGLNEYHRFIDNLVSLYFNTSEVGHEIYQNYGGNFEFSDIYIKQKSKHN